MNKKDILRIFNSYGALLTGHFLLSSGLHSDKYIQCALVLQYPEIAEKLAKELVKKLAKVVSLINISAVISPAVGGIIIGQEVARVIGCRAIFTERDAGKGKMKLRRGFEIKPDDHCLIVEDVITTGGSVKEVIDVVKNSGGETVAIGAIVDRMQKNPNFSLPFVSLIKLNINTYLPKMCPLCKANLILTKPGSRNLTNTIPS